MIWQSGSVQLAPLFDSKIRFPPPGRKNFPITLFLVCSSLRMIWRRLRHNTISSGPCQGKSESFFRSYLLMFQAFIDGSKKRSRGRLRRPEKSPIQTEHDSCFPDRRRRSGIVPNIASFPKENGNSRCGRLAAPRGIPRSAARPRLKSKETSPNRDGMEKVRRRPFLPASAEGPPAWENVPSTPGTIPA